MISILASLGLILTQAPAEVCAELKVDYYHNEAGNHFQKNFVSRERIILENFDDWILSTRVGATMYLVKLTSTKEAGDFKVSAEIYDANWWRQPGGFDLSLKEGTKFEKIATKPGELQFTYKSEKGAVVTEYHIASFELNHSEDCE